MGKRIVYTTTPRRPRAAKIAWNLFSKKGEIESLYFDASHGNWIAKFKNGQAKQVSSSSINLS